MNDHSEAPARQAFKETLEAALDVLEKEAAGALGVERRGGVVRLRQKWPLVVVGDLHGHPGAWRRAWSIIEDSGACDSGLAVFLGDYVDRGPAQAAVLAGVLEAKLECPQRVVVLRGNHEPPAGLEPYPHDFPYHLAKLYDDPAELYQLARRVFDAMPYAALVEGYALLVHGGPPARRLLEGHQNPLAEGEEEPRDVLAEVLWNDPDDYVEEIAPNPRGVGYLWGPKVTRLALERLGVKLIIRGHEPAEGIRLNHEGRVVTVFTYYGPPYYNSAGAVLTCSSPEDRVEDCAVLIP